MIIFVHRNVLEKKTHKEIVETNNLYRCWLTNKLQNDDIMNI